MVELIRAAKSFIMNESEFSNIGKGGIIQNTDATTRVNGIAWIMYKKSG